MAHLRVLWSAVILILLLSTFAGGQTPGRLFTVTSDADSYDAIPGNGICADSQGRCTLRSAIDESNAEPSGRDVVIFSLQYPAVIFLAGPLQINGNLSVVGPGARRLSIEIDQVNPPTIEGFPLIAASGQGSNVMVRGLTLRHGAGLEFGGNNPAGAFNVSAGVTAVLADAVLTDNYAYRGGAIHNRGTLTITRSLFASNKASQDGGAIQTFPGSTTRIFNSTFSGNRARNGGSIHASGTLVSVNNTFALGESTATNFILDLGFPRDIYSSKGSQVYLMNTLVVSDNTHFTHSLFGNFISLGNNFITDNRDSIGFTNGVNGDQVRNDNSLNPMIGPLADNGGQTNTHALNTGSPAINMGNSCVFLGPCPSVPGSTVRLFYDQRAGYFRGGIIDAVDIGAFEVQNGSSSGSTLGSIPGIPSPRTFYNNSQLILINVETGKRIYRSIGPGGPIRTPNLPPGVVFVQELANKRSAFKPPPVVIAFPD